MAVAFRNKKDFNRMGRAVRAYESTALGRNQQNPHKIYGNVSSDTYNGPFQCVRKNDTTVTIKAYDGSTYYAHNYIIAGLDRIEVTTDVDVTITASGFVYIHVWYSGGYQYSFSNVAALPSQTDGHYYKTIAMVKLESGVCSVLAQVCRDEIHVAGRIV